MREVTGMTWVFQLVVMFILIFACFLILVLNYSKVYGLKNDTLTIIEKYEGVTSESLGIINNVLKNKGYKATGTCPNEWYGVIDYDGNVEKSVSGKKYYYCFKEEGKKDNIYYNVKLYYKFNLPFLGELTTFTVNGRTNSFIGNNSRIK